MDWAQAVGRSQSGGEPPHSKMVAGTILPQKEGRFGGRQILLTWVLVDEHYRTQVPAPSAKAPASESGPTQAETQERTASEGGPYTGRSLGTRVVTFVVLHKMGRDRYAVAGDEE
jgi:hypothetical protein